MPEVPESPGPESDGTPGAAGSAGPRWPRVVGTIGIVVGALMFLDKLNDLLFLPVLGSREWWADLVGEEIGELVMGWLPPTAWVVFASLVGMSLGALLVVGALRLRRGRRSGAALCRAWSWLTIGWLLVEIGAALWWLSVHAAELRQLAPDAAWEGSAALGVALVLVFLAAFPAFLLTWLSRPAIKAQLAGWPG